MKGNEMTKVTVNLDKLLSEELIDEDMARVLKENHSSNTIKLAAASVFAILALGIAVGTLLLFKSMDVLGALAAVVLIASTAVFHWGDRKWRMLTHSGVVLGSVGVCTWWLYFLTFYGGDGPMYIAVVPIVFVLLLFGTLNRNVLLIATSVIAVGPLLGVDAWYQHASYAFVSRDSGLGIIGYATIAAIAYGTVRVAHGKWKKLPYTAAGVAFFMVHMNFWVGSLWGTVARVHASGDLITIQPGMYALLWALTCAAILGFSLWHNMRAAVVTAIVFLGINGFTQYHEFFFEHPKALLPTCIALFVLVWSMWRYYWDTSVAAQKT